MKNKEKQGNAWKSNERMEKQGIAMETWKA